MYYHVEREELVKSAARNDKRAYYKSQKEALNAADLLTRQTNVPVYVFAVDKIAMPAPCIFSDFRDINDNDSKSTEEEA